MWTRVVDCCREIIFVVDGGGGGGRERERELELELENFFLQRL